MFTTTPQCLKLKFNLYGEIKITKYTMGYVELNSIVYEVNSDKP
jgi:hypothetical protein